MRVRLVKKLAEKIDGVDLRAHDPGDTLDLSRSEARLLIAEGWAKPEGRTEQRQYVSAASDASEPAPAIAADRPRRGLVKLR